MFLVGLDSSLENQVKKHIAKYRVQGYSDQQIRQALLNSNVDSLVISKLMQGESSGSITSFEVNSKPFYKKWWFFVPSIIIIFFAVLFIIFLLTEDREGALEELGEDDAGLEELAEDVTISEIDDFTEEEIVCGDEICSDGEDCGLDCGCLVEDDCPEGYNCNDGECISLTASEAISNTSSSSRSSGGGGGSSGGGSSGGSSSGSSGSSSSSSGSSSTAATCIDSDCGAYVCDTSLDACFSSCNEDSSCSSEYYCSIGNICEEDTECSDGIDNDNDSGVDLGACDTNLDGSGDEVCDEEADECLITCGGQDYYMLNDSECAARSDSSEGATCSNFIDDDGDGFIDYFGACDIDDDKTADYVCGCDEDSDGLLEEGEFISRDECVEKMGGETAAIYGCDVDLDDDVYSYNTVYDCTLSGEVYYSSDADCGSPLGESEGVSDLAVSFVEQVSEDPAGRIIVYRVNITNLASGSEEVDMNMSIYFEDGLQGDCDHRDYDIEGYGEVSFDCTFTIAASYGNSLTVSGIVNADFTESVEELDETNNAYEFSDEIIFDCLNDSDCSTAEACVTSGTERLGECVASCIDGDASEDITVYGTIIGVHGGGYLESADSCSSDTSVLEYYCDGSGFITSDTSSCSSGEVCDGGVCIVSSSSTTTAAPYASADFCYGDEDCSGENEVCVSYVCYTAECSDGIDNDGDESIDSSDSDCESLTDNSESSTGRAFAYAPSAGEEGFFSRIWNWFLGLFGVEA